MTPVLQLHGVAKEYRMGDERVHVLIDFDFTLDAGEFVVVTGPSGAGKSTLLHIAGGLDAPDTGTLAVAGQDVWAMSTGLGWVTGLGTGRPSCRADRCNGSRWRVRWWPGRPSSSRHAIGTHQCWTRPPVDVS